MSPVYRKSAGIKATKNKNTKDKKFLTKTTSANPGEGVMVSRHSKGTNIQYNLNTNNKIISDQRKQCLGYSYSTCANDDNCSWSWIIPNLKGHCK